MVYQTAPFSMTLNDS